MKLVCVAFIFVVFTVSTAHSSICPTKPVRSTVMKAMEAPANHAVQFGVYTLPDVLLKRRFINCISVVAKYQGNPPNSISLILREEDSLTVTVESGVNLPLNSTLHVYGYEE